MALIDKLDKIYGETKKRNPGKAKRIAERVSGELFGLYPTMDSYESDKTIKVEFEDGEMITDLREE